GLAFALLVSVPAGYGLYGAFFPAIPYFFLGTSKHLSIGPFPVVSLMVGSVVTRLVPADGSGNSTAFPGNLTLEEKQVLVAGSVTILAGIMQLALGVLQVGFIVIYLSDSLVSGFTTAAAIHVLVSQLKFIFTLKVPGFSGPLAIIYTLESIFTQITDTNIADLVTSIIIMVVIFIVKEINDHFKSKLPVPIPIEVIVTIIATGVSYAFNFEERYGVDIIGNLPRGYQPPLTPSIYVFQQSIGDAFSVAIVGFAVAFSVAKVYAMKHDYVIDGNQELIAFGVSNVFTGAFRGFATSTALSRTAIQESTGGKSQIAGVVSAIIVLIVIVAVGPLLRTLQKNLSESNLVKNLTVKLKAKVKNPLKNTWDPSIHTYNMVSIEYDKFAPAVNLTQKNNTNIILKKETVHLKGYFLDNFSLPHLFRSNGQSGRREGSFVDTPLGSPKVECRYQYCLLVNFFKGSLAEKNVGFNPLRILRKRNKALARIKKLLKKGELEVTPKGYINTGNISNDSDEEVDNNNIEELDKPTNTKDLPVNIDWNSELPANIVVPRVDIHSIILDFGAVSFIDMSAMKGLKGTFKEFIRINVDVYIVGCDNSVIEKLERCQFFDEEVKNSMFFLTIHDAVLYILEKHDPENIPNFKPPKYEEHDFRKSSISKGELRNRDCVVPVETKF
uniref:Solute carrier family 26 member 3 n=1 Tax=Latimeria chalumnae TaxID=7897 RepID=H3AN20_LATCH